MTKKPLNNQVKKDTILLVGSVIPAVARSLATMNKEVGVKYKYLLLTDSKGYEQIRDKEGLEVFEDILMVDANSEKSITDILSPYRDRLLAVTCRSEAMIPFFQKIIPHIPYLRTPTGDSLTWSTNKLAMRRRFRVYDRKITPKFMVVSDAKKITLKEIDKKIGFPLVIKPSGLASSLLVSICFHQEELEKSLKRILRRINRIHKEAKGRGEPQILVEQFIDGDMYSVDGYVNSRGKVYFCPLVSVKTGKSVGFDDFFAYQTMTPTTLNKESIKAAEEVSLKAVHALGLRSITAHIELLKTEKGWKVIEVGPRIGGFRQKMYELSFGINHTANDIFIRIPRRPKPFRRVKGHTAVLKIFAKDEGRIMSLTGIKKVQTLKSFNTITVNQKVGDKAIFAKHGGKSIFNITLFNKDRSRLLADIRRLEQMIKIVTKK
ncbi:MAG: ATP-grasp domain-containing protein [Candidatus Paceibacterota bacterium]